ncbi:MAG: D-glycero-alpha-D-manno-heptose-1,7-bisphosphate 7-phosphatase [Bacteroidota bacterium]
MNLKNLGIDKSWTLFLDRDGVINKKIENDYIKKWEEFEFIPGVKEAIATLNNIFGLVFVVTNQQGIAKGLYSESDLESIHLNMMLDVILAGGQIDRIYFAPELASAKSNMRKPSIGMAEKAKEDFPSIDFSKSIIIGDSISDMEFGRNAGMKTIFFNNLHPGEDSKSLIDFHFKNWTDLKNDFN